ncbi:MAG: hypothetical protein ABDI19_12855, partial [Armatimonadota bacterium]
ERVNLAKARLLVSIYEAQVRVAYQQYRAIRQEEEARFAIERPEAEQRNDVLREQIRGVEEAMAQLRARWQPQLDALREQLYSAWQDAYTKAAAAGINLRGDPLTGDALPIDAGQSLGDHPVATPTAEPPRAISPAGQNLPATATTPNPHPPSLTPAEVMHQHHLPSYQGGLIPKPLWVIMVILVGIGLGLVLALAAGLIVPGQPISEPLPLALVLLAGVALTYLGTRALWGAAAVVAELYHLFGWDESKARRAAWGIGAGLTLLVLTAALLAWLLIGMAQASASLGGWAPLALLGTALMMVLLLGCALLEGFLEGRYKPFGHWIASRITQHEREQFEHASEASHRETGTQRATMQGDASQSFSTSAGSAAPSEAEQAAWVAIRRYQALYRQYSHLRSEMEQELMPYRERIEQLKAEMRPIYPTLPPHSRNRIALAYRHWEQAYRFYLQHLADALRECQGGEELAALVQAQMPDRNRQPL